MSEAALAIVESESSQKQPSVLIRLATDVATVCKAVVVSTAIEIDGKRYIPVEGWATIAAAYGCAPSIREVFEEERGIRAIAELRRADGTIVASAEGFCGLDEPKWSNRALYARRGMAQTRAISRVCRTAFAFVVTLMQAGLQTTPAEEIPTGNGGASVALVDVQPSVVGSVVGRAPPERTKTTSVRFGKSKGKFLCDIDAKDLEWQAAAARKSVEANDPKWGDSNKQWLTTVEAEVARRAGA
jgi:hypothetical protein